jgi:hypothetical protein
MSNKSSDHPDAPVPAQPARFDVEEHLSLYKFKILTEIKDDILDWAKVRLGIVVTLLSLLIATGSFVGIRLLVEGQIEKIAKQPVEQQIQVLQTAGREAQSRVEGLKLASEQATAMSFSAQQELARLKAEANDARRFVKETEPTIQKLEKLGLDLKKQSDSFKTSADVSRQHFHEQALKTKADMLLMRNNVELLQAGFEIIEKLAAEIRQADPQSELARQFAGFGAQWRAARDIYVKRAAVIRSRRDIKIIHYVRDDAPPLRHQQSEQLVNALLAEGYTAEGWTTNKGGSELEAAVEVAKEFGIDPKLLLRPTVIVSPASEISIEDLKEIAARVGLSLPDVRRQDVAPNKALIQRGGENGGFKPTNIILIAELGDG